LDVSRSAELYDLTWTEHPTYWVRVWVKPQVDNPEPAPIAWNADSFRITGAVDAEEVFAWARQQDGWTEIFVELADANPPAAVAIAGFNPSRSDGRRPADFISDAHKASDLAALLDDGR
jgi:hypothetical protein